MSFFQSAYNLFFDQKSFFAENKDKGLTVPIILTLIYAVVTAAASVVLMMPAADAAAGLFGILAGISVVSSVISAVVVWLVVSALFFACLKFIGYAECSYKQVLAVCGYVSGILIFQSVFEGLVSLIGTAPAILLLLLEGVFLLWSVPVWYFGFKSVCDIPEKKLKMSVAVPVIVMVLFTVIPSAGAILAF